MPIINNGASHFAAVTYTGNGSTQTISTANNNTGDKSVIIAHYDKQLKEIEENGILEWILDRRADTDKRERSRNMIRKEYPDTRGHYEE